ncbi:MAG: S8 family serine peptidase [Acidobacteriota bacterium]|nr:S8 family serine peptidase [Acidobacteriota bacterium]
METTRRKGWIWLESIVLIFAVVFGSALTSAQAQSTTDNPKISNDLEHLIANDPDVTHVDAVITTPDTPTKSLLSYLTTISVKVDRKLANIPILTVRLPIRQGQATNIAARDDVSYISLDRVAKRTGHLSLTTGADAARTLGGATEYNGSGIGIAVLDSGVFTDHASFSKNGVSRVTYSADFTGEGRTDDPYGHGTHVAGAVAAGDTISNGAYKGIAPAANIINLRVLGADGTGKSSAILAAIDWIISNRTTYNIRVVNMSLGTNAVDSYKNDPLCRAARKLVDLGIVVVAAAGNQGKDSAGNKLYGLIHSPGIEPSVITVGASNSYGTDVRSDDVMASYSSRGPTRGYWTDSFETKHYDNLIKPDLVAPGNKIIEAQSPANKLVTENPTLDAKVSSDIKKNQMYLSGTSMSTPVVAGAAALLLQANPKLTPNLVKMLLMYTAQPIQGANHFEQGAGQVNIEGAVKLARLVRQDLTATTLVGSPLLTTVAPSAQSTIAGQSFTWGQGAVMDHSYARGSNLITKYQAVYGLGKLLIDGTVETNGVLMADGVYMSDGIVMGDNILTVNGVLMSDGLPFLSCGVLMSDGVMMSDGITMGDGVLMSDGVMMGDGVMMADVAATANKALLEGDATASMKKVDDIVLTPNAPDSLKATAVSSSRIDLSWIDSAANESGFRVEQSLDGVTYTQVATLAANTQSYSNTGLSAKKKYYYRVVAFNSYGASEYSTVASATTLK